jgi:hypothetical protein
VELYLCFQETVHVACETVAVTSEVLLVIDAAVSVSVVAVLVAGVAVPVAGAAGPGAGAAGSVDLVVAHVAGELHIPLSCGKLYILVPGLMYV